MTFLKSARNVDNFTYFNQSKSHNRRKNISKYIRNYCVRIYVYEFIGIYKNIIFSTVVVVLIYTLLKFNVISDNDDSSVFDVTSILQIVLSFSRSFFTRRISRTV